MAERVEFTHRSNRYCIHSFEWLSTEIGEGGFRLPTVEEGTWGECSTTARWARGRTTARYYARKDGQVVWSSRKHVEHCMKFGAHGTIPHTKAVLYAIWLQGYEPVYVPHGHRRPNDCLQYDRAMDHCNTWRGPVSDMVDDYTIVVPQEA